MYSFKGTYHYAILFFLSLRMFKIYMYSHRNFTLYILYNFLSKRVPMNPWLYPDFPFREIMFIFSSFLVISQFPHILMSHDIYIYIYRKDIKKRDIRRVFVILLPAFYPYQHHTKVSTLCPKRKGYNTKQSSEQEKGYSTRKTSNLNNLSLRLVYHDHRIR